MLEIIKNRVYSDYFIPSRLNEYEKIVRLLIENEYKILTVKDYKKLLDTKYLKGKYFINRHDIDTDISTAKKFFEIEKKYNVKATYYFRLSTLNFNFMKEIEKHGSEASYHFEEIAQFAKDNHIKSKDEILNRMDEIKNLFKKNFIDVESKLGYKLLTVCSHGDFVNRKLNIVNNEITNDMKLRKELGILCETYDEDLLSSVNIYVSDKPYPKFWYPDDIKRFIGDKQVIYMLTHPRQWRVNWKENTIDNLRRIYEGVVW